MIPVSWQLPLWNAWFWASVALLLVVLEILIPGEFFLWFGVAALLTALVSLLTPAWQYQVGAFAVFSLLSIAVAVHRLRRRPARSANPLLNRRLQALIGAVGEVKKPIPLHGKGAVYVDGSLWLATARESIPAGTPVRVRRVRNLVLEVEPLESEK